MPTLRIPLATYRLQFNAQFGFKHARALVGYFNHLGVTDLYSSPLLQARLGSLHGYDVTDPSRLNTEIGSELEFETLGAALKERRMGLLLDIVPNHMASGSENPWWMDVLEDGPGSAFASFFDIDWHPPRRTLQNKVLLPILSRPYAQALENQELRLAFEQGGFFVNYSDVKLPVAPKSYLAVLRHRIDELQRRLGRSHAAFRELRGICVAVSNLPERIALSTELAGERRLQREALKERLWRLHEESGEVRKFVDENVRIFNGERKRPRSFVLLDKLLAEQAYVLTYWLSSNDEINYRRFFTITNLVGVRVEDPLVFEATHAVVLRLIERGLVTGLRIDHIDGLRDPHAYLRRLQERAAGSPGNGAHPPFYVLVEKILIRGEKLPQEWPICGATGYASLNAINGLFVDSGGCKRLREIYYSFIGATVRYEDLVYEKKKEVMQTLLAVEMRSLGHYLVLLAEQDRYARDLPRIDLAKALAETTACFPVYRTYIRGFSLSPDERHYVEMALEAARRRNPRLGSNCFDFVGEVLLLREKGHVTPEQREARLAFIMRWQQFTGPIMAKGFEDSALYVYNPLTSLNEVGGNPDSTGMPVPAFHAFCRSRQKHGHSLNATSTHDTKRAEDVRARINVLSEMPATWEKCLRHWTRLNRQMKKQARGQGVPDLNEEVLLYQTMLGAWPLEPEGVTGFRKRLQVFALKAAREAGTHTQWNHPNVRYERALSHFIRMVTQPSKENSFMASFLNLWQEVAFYGAVNSLAQLLVKITMPGVPDIYQGSELWDFRLVDPDNRDPVAFDKRVRLLAGLEGEQERTGRRGFVQDLLNRWQDGRVKLFVTSAALNFRTGHDALFLEGTYHAVQASGTKKENVIAFARHLQDTWSITAVPRFSARLALGQRFPIGECVWAASTLVLPSEAPANWVNVLTGEVLEACGAKQKQLLPLAGVFKSFPVALLANQR
ncbi:MAG TPA: malto-oligosyltrehalose synthase [Terriglobia bacterium]|nr:malto-oligosyltrehalose synthase [Terriglobia bacterium]